MSDSSQRSAKAGAREVIAARAVRLAAKAATAEAISPTIEERALVRERDDQVVVEIAAAGVNPSDIKAAIGMMPYAVFPRTPGRDFAGRIVAGPADLVGREVFGTGGDVGIRRDGTHASHVVLERAAVVEKPSGISACTRQPASVCRSSRPTRA